MYDVHCTCTLAYTHKHINRISAQTISNKHTHTDIYSILYTVYITHIDIYTCTHILHTYTHTPTYTYKH